MKKFGMLLMTFAIMLFACFVTVRATEEEPKSPVTGVQISEDGVLTFDAFEGANQYWLGVDQGFKTVESGDSIMQRLDDLCNYDFETGLCGAGFEGRYYIQVQAAKDGNPISSYYEGFLTYDGTKFTLEATNGNFIVMAFDSNGGTPVEKMFVKKGEPLPRPDAPTKEGKTFLGWFLDEECTEEFKFDDLGHLYGRLYAKWGDPIDIDSVVFTGVTIPVGGTHPDAELFKTISTTTEGLRVIMASWFEEGEGGKELTSEDTFQAGKRYRLSIVVEFNDGYRFKEAEDFWIEDHAELGVEPLGRDFIKDRNEFQFPFDAVAAPDSGPNLDGFKIKSANTSSVKLAWNKVDEAKGYIVYTSTNGKKWSKLTTITKNTTTTYKHKKLKAGTTHYYRVEAYKVVKKKNKVLAKSKELRTSTVPTAPKVKVKSTTFNSVKINIGKSKGAQTYMVERSTDKKTYEVLTVFAKAGNYTDKELATGTKYYYRVSACNERCSAKSKVVNAKPALKAPSIKVSSKTKAEVKVTYKNVTGAEVYEVYRSTKKNGKYELVGSENALQYVDTTAKSKKTYYYKVRATIKVGEKVVGTYSKPIKVKVK